MLWNLRPVRLMEVLASMNGFWMIGGVIFDGALPVIGSPNDFDACASRAFCETTETGEKIDGFHFFFLASIVAIRMAARTSMNFGISRPDKSSNKQ